MKILIVEDEQALATGLRFNFEQEGYEVHLAGDGMTALNLFRSAEPPFDVVTLDLMLPGMSGYEVCREIRDRDGAVPILVLSARTLSEDRTMAFDCGADQYLSKPFALPELLSRVRNLTNPRRGKPAAEPDPAPVADEYTFGNNIEVRFEQFELVVDGETHTLTTMEMQLLRYFVEHENRVLSRTQIMNDVWSDSSALSSRSIDNFVMRLRRLIEPDAQNPQHILSVRGTGYRFVAGE